MEIVKTVVAAVLSFIAGFTSHVLAHDFCERTPRMARWIIAKAVAHMPPHLRERYSEEWSAALAETDGVLAKFKHVVGCLRSVRRFHINALRQVRFDAHFNFSSAGRVCLSVDFYQLSWCMMFVRNNPNFLRRISMFALAAFFLSKLMVALKRQNQLNMGQFRKALSAFNKDTIVPERVDFCLGSAKCDVMAIYKQHGLPGLQEFFKVLTSFLKSNPSGKDNSEAKPS